MPRLFCFGLGFTATRLAHRLLRQGWAVDGTCRDPDKARALGREGIPARVFDGERPLEAVEEAFDGVTHVLVSVPPDEAGDPVVRHHGADLARLPALAWLGYLSTTGVYGDRGGGWVDEDSALEPTTERGRRRLEAERQWLSLWRARGLPAHLFRLVGIYGPGRSALDSLRAGRARRIDKPGQVFNRIHVDDIGTALIASMERPAPGTAYNIADDDPAPSPDVMAHAAALLGQEPPPLVAFDEAGLSPMARSFYAENKRVRNDRMKRALGVALRFPSYKDGLAAQLAAERAGSAA